MERESFILTIFFLTLGPIKIIASFAKLTQAFDLKFKREVAIKGILVAGAICLYVALLGRGMLTNYQISLEALRLAAGLVLLLSALNGIFPRVQPANSPTSQPTALQLAISPVATPMVVPPVGIAAILIFVMLIPEYPGMEFAIAKGLLTMLALDFLVMFFIDKILKLPGLMMVLQVFGSVLVFFQVALAIQTILGTLKSLGVVNMK
jgi:multiple antibiotic resistance protein